MSRHNRECPQCGLLFEGRPNKKFCSELCKGRYFRDTASANIVEPTTTDQLPRPETLDPSTLTHTHLPALPSESVEDVWEQIRQAQQDEDDKALATKLHQRFSYLVSEFLNAEGKELTADEVQEQLESVQEFTATYRQHPHLKKSGTQTKRRLQELYEVEDVLQEVAREIAERTIWQGRMGSYELTKKWRKLLRELMIAD